MCSVVTDVTVQSEIQIVGTEIDTGAFHQSQVLVCVLFVVDKTILVGV